MDGEILRKSSSFHKNRNSKYVSTYTMIRYTLIRKYLSVKKSQILNKNRILLSGWIRFRIQVNILKNAFFGRFSYKKHFVFLSSFKVLMITGIPKSKGISQY
jgi:hypothetical protein